MYNLYNMYMNYNLSTFRNNIREAFNKAEAGEEVLVERFGLYYSLSLTEQRNTVSIGSVLSVKAPNTTKVTISDLKKRAIPDILVDIDTLKRQCAEELEYCQDPETRHSIEDEYKNRIQALWDEYKALKEAK